MNLVVEWSLSEKDFLGKSLLVRTYFCVKSLYPGHHPQHQKSRSGMFHNRLDFYLLLDLLLDEVEAVSI
jgi:hypothetical protein